MILSGFLLLSLLIYRDAIPVPLSSDARFLTYQNEFVTEPAGFVRFWTSDMFEGAQTHGVTYRSGYYRPVLNLQFWLEYQWARDNDALYNLSQILLHGFVAWLVVLLVGRIGADPVAGLLAGLLFLVHPVHAFAATEPAARGDVLFTLFFLTALLVFDRTLTRTSDRRSPWVSLLIVTGLYLASILSKEMGATLPGVLVALVVLRAARGQVKLRRVLWTLPAWTAFGGYLIWRFVVLELPTFQAGYDATFSRGELFLAALKTVPIHLSRILVPLGPGYPELNPLLVNTVGPGLSDPLTWVAMTVVGALAAGAVLLWRRTPEAAFWCAFFLITFTPLLRVENIAGTLDTSVILTQERWIYLPAMAVLGGAARGLLGWLRGRGLLRTRRRRVCTVTVGSMAITALAVTASVHAGMAEDPFAQLRRLYLLPEESLSRFELANRLLLYAHFVAAPQGDMEDAERRAREALELVPDSPLSARSAAEILALRGNWEEVASLLRPWLQPEQEWLDRMAETNPRVYDDWNRVNPRVILLMARASAHMNRQDDARAFFCEALRRGVSEDTWIQAVREAPGVPPGLECGTAEG